MRTDVSAYQNKTATAHEEKQDRISLPEDRRFAGEQEPSRIPGDWFPWHAKQTFGKQFGRHRLCCGRADPSWILMASIRAYLSFFYFFLFSARFSPKAVSTLGTSSSAGVIMRWPSLDPIGAGNDGLSTGHAPAHPGPHAEGPWMRGGCDIHRPSCCSIPSLLVDEYFAKYSMRLPQGITI